MVAPLAAAPSAPNAEVAVIAAVVVVMVTVAAKCTPALLSSTLTEAFADTLVRLGPSSAKRMLPPRSMVSLSLTVSPSRSVIVALAVSEILPSARIAN